MSEIEKMKRYVERTKIDPITVRGYQMRVGEALALNATTNGRAVDAICLAFEFGMAKGLRMARAEGKA